MSGDRGRLGVGLPDADVPAPPPVPAARPLEVVARRRTGHHPHPRWWSQLRLPAPRGWLQQLHERIEERWSAPDPIRRCERAVWAAAGSLEELGELTARWLTGDLDSQPGYYGPVDVDEADAPGLTAALLAANEWGWWTRNSQAGYDGLDLGGHWRQLAWVSGHLDPEHPQLPALVAAARRAGYQAIQWNPAAGRRVVTWFQRSPVTVDSWTPPEELREQCTGLNEQATARVLASVQLSILDPIPGRNTLWAWLTDALSGPQPSTEQARPGEPGAVCSCSHVPAHHGVHGCTENWVWVSGLLLIRGCECTATGTATVDAGCER